jgi:hypothetical protein
VGILIAVPVIGARLATRLTFTKRLWADDYVSMFTLVRNLDSILYRWQY